MSSPQTIGANRQRTINLAPHPLVLLESLRSIGYTIETALADILDNSITAGSTWISVRFAWNSGEPWIAVADDGCGMTRPELTDAMRFGSASPLLQREERDLGRFGLGLKTASISQCRHLTVASCKDGETNAAEWNLESMAAEDSDEWSLGISDADEIHKDSLLSDLFSKYIGGGGHGTVVLWRLLGRSLAGAGTDADEVRFNELLDSSRKHLETVFHRYLSPDFGFSAIRIDFNGSNLVAFNPFGPTVPARQELAEEVISLRDGVVRIQPFILPHHTKIGTAEYQKYAGEEGYLHNQGFYIYRQRRLIVKATWFRLIKKEEMNKLIRVRVDIPNSLDHLWNINVNKSQVYPPESVRKELKKIVGRISGSGKRVYQRRATKLIHRNLTPVWRREVSEGNIYYRVNQEHPMLKHLIDSFPDEKQRQIKSAIALIESSFPTDALYADAANDDVDVNDAFRNPVELYCAVSQLLEALLACGFDGNDLRTRMLETEIPGMTEELIEEILGDRIHA